MVDYFVIAEAPITFRGRTKTLTFAENHGRFKRFLPKICRITVNDMPTGRDPWRRERHQRNALRQGLTDVGHNDFVIVSGPDGIPRASAVENGCGRWRLCLLRDNAVHTLPDFPDE